MSSRAEPEGRCPEAAGAAWRIGEALSVCPVCDLLHRRRRLAPGDVARCRRCASVMETRKRDAPERVIAAALANLLLLGIALWAPFLTLAEGGITQRISLADTVAALSGGTVWPLGALLIAFIIAAPMLRALAYLYALVPVRAGLGAPAGAADALRLATRLRPWAMAEVFVIGAAVSLVKLAGMATVTPGPAFWALGGMVLVIGFENASHCRESLWAGVEARR